MRTESSANDALTFCVEEGIGAQETHDLGICRALYMRTAATERRVAESIVEYHNMQEKLSTSGTKPPYVDVHQIGRVLRMLADGHTYKSAAADVGRSLNWAMKLAEGTTCAKLTTRVFPRELFLARKRKGLRGHGPRFVRAALARYERDDDADAEAERSAAHAAAERTLERLRRTGQYTRIMELEDGSHVCVPGVPFSTTDEIL